MLACAHPLAKELSRMGRTLCEKEKCWRSEKVTAESEEAEVEKQLKKLRGKCDRDERGLTENERKWRSGQNDTKSILRYQQMLSRAPDKICLGFDVVAEMFPNGGKSCFDLVLRVEFFSRQMEVLAYMLQKARV